MNRKLFLGTLFGFSIIGSLKAAAKEKIGKLIKDYAADTLQVKRLEITDEGGNACGFLEVRDGKLVVGNIKREDLPRPPVQNARRVNSLELKHQETDPNIVSF
jgi:hypothetical protein